MKLSFLGCGSAYFAEWGNTNAYFIKNETLFIIDSGETTFTRLKSLGILSGAENIVLLLTHLHTDHCGSIGSLLSYCKIVLKKKVKVIHPITSVVKFLENIDIDNSFYELLSERDINIEGINFSAIEVNHSDKMKCFGYLISDGEEEIFYGGDSEGIPPKMVQRLIENKISKIYQDTTYEFGIPHGHCTLEWLINNVPYNKRDHIYCMHLGSDFTLSVKSSGFKVVTPDLCLAGKPV